MHLAKNQWLHGLRGTACVIVVAGHLVLTFYPQLFEYTNPFRLFYNGTMSVYVFFCLSAYVLSHKFFLYHDKNIIVSGMLRRYFRLTIPVLASAFWAYMLLYAGAYGNVEVGNLVGSKWLSSFWRFDANFWMMLKTSVYYVYTPDYYNLPIYNAVLWTMRIELLGSFLVFLFCLLFGKFRYRWFLYAFLVYYTFQTEYLCFALGLLLSDATKQKQVESFLQQEWVKGVIALLFCIALVFGPYSTEVWMYSLSAFGLVLGVDTLLFCRRLLTKKLFVFLGDISFSLYLVHLPLIGSFTCWVYLFSHSTALAYATTLPLVFGVACLFNHYVDANAILLSKKFERLLRHEFGRLGIIKEK